MWYVWSAVILCVAVLLYIVYLNEVISGERRLNETTTRERNHAYKKWDEVQDERYELDKKHKALVWEYEEQKKALKRAVAALEQQHSMVKVAHILCLGREEAE